MGFSTSLQGQSAQEALLIRQDAEIKLLESMKRCLALKVKSDREYASTMSSLSLQVKKAERHDDLFGSLINQSWKDIMDSIDQTAKLIKQQADSMENIVVEQISNLYSERRRARKAYQEEHIWLNNQFQQLTDDVARKKTEYQKNLEIYKLARSKFEEHYINRPGKGGRKLDDVREKYQKACRKLHLTHNEYVLLIGSVTECEQELRTSYLPKLLRRQQAIHLEFIVTWKGILQDVVKYSDFTSENFLEIRSRMQASVDSIKPADEYKDFICKHRTRQAVPLLFTFAENLDDAPGTLLPNKLAIDNLTIDWLKSRLNELEILMKPIQASRNENGFDTSKVAIMDYTIEREQIRLRCKEKKFLREAGIIRSALNELGCEEVPSGCDLSMADPFVEQTSTLIVSCDTDNSSIYEKENGDLINEDWFHGVLPREEVVRLLVTDGDFLVRETTRNHECQLVLSVCWDGHKHFIVQTTQEGHFRFEGPSFTTIPELIMHQWNSGLPVTARSGAILKMPICRERWELNNDDVELMEKIGRGNFGDVYRAQLKTSQTEVAVKTCRVALPDEQKRKFLHEGRILKQYDHPNIVKLIGICVQKQPIMIVMELVHGGSLLTYLRKNSSLLGQTELLSCCRDAAAGMTYLESKYCIHRDLAARNCLVSLESVIKISDFGMSREEEEYIVSDGMKQIPIKWTAPEALNFGKYTSLCDVWSYGVLMWEIFSKGGNPYSGLTNTQARERIDAGYRLPAPEGTPEEVYTLMLRCWDYQPENRPHFNQIHSAIEALYRSYLRSN